MSRPNLLIFDLDGTLTLTVGSDWQCFRTSLREVFDITNPEASWGKVKNITDSGGLEEIYDDTFGNKPSDDEVTRFKDDFHTRLRASADRDPTGFRQVRGARALLGQLEDTDWRIGIATGCWLESAELKIERSGLAPFPGPLATADDHVARVGIVKTAIRNLAPEATDPNVVLVGDGVWDVQAAKDLGYPLIGVGTGDGARKLHDAGADSVLSDLSDADRFVELLETLP